MIDAATSTLTSKQLGDLAMALSLYNLIDLPPEAQFYKIGKVNGEVRAIWMTASGHLAWHTNLEGEDCKLSLSGDKFE